MPIIDVYKEDLEKLIGKKISIQELEDLLDYVKSELDDFIEEENLLRIEVKDTNRPDLWSVEGIARVLRSILGNDRGFKHINVRKSSYKIIVDKRLKNIRPFIVSLVAKGGIIDKFVLSSFLQLQEKLASNLGNNREKLAIGFYDNSKIKWPLYYTLADKSEKMIPLYHNNFMTLEEILEKTEQGKKYGYLVRSLDKYPVLKDSTGKIIGFLPIVNSDDVGRINENTKEIFVDISGNDLNIQIFALIIISYALVDRGFKIYSVNINYPDFTIETPNFKSKIVEVNLDNINEILGVKLDINKVVDLLGKYNYNVVNIENKKLNIEVPPYRRDVFDYVDVAEDVAIVIGYNNFSPELPKFYSEGGLLDYTKFIEKLKDLMIGLKLIEVRNPVLTSYNLIVEKANRYYAKDRIVFLENPVSSNYNVVRDSIYPLLINFISLNKNKKFPINIFEIGRVAYLEDGKIKEEDRLTILLAYNRVNFTDIKSYLKEIEISLDIKFRLKESNLDDLVEGRQAYICLKDKNIIGVMGEIHPKILESFEINIPISVLELNVSKLYKVYNRQL